MLKNTDKLDATCQSYKKDTVIRKHEKFMKHLEKYWKRHDQWAICFRDQTLLRGNNTNNYAESSIRILKDIIFRRVNTYNLVQLFDFVTVTFELYYARRLLAVAHNRMDRYIALRFKGLGASKVNMSHIRKPDSEDVYIVKSKGCDGVEYKIDTKKWPTGEPCRHQAAIAPKYNLVSMNYTKFQCIGKVRICSSGGRH